MVATKLTMPLMLTMFTMFLGILKLWYLCPFFRWRMTNPYLRLLRDSVIVCMPQEGYLHRFWTRTLNPSTRQDALSWILKEGKVWMIQLLSVACLSLAAKMEETHVPLPLDLQKFPEKEESRYMRRKVEERI